MSEKEQTSPKGSEVTPDPDEVLRKLLKTPPKPKRSRQEAKKSEQK
jgi:hypothetical protein